MSEEIDVKGKLSVLFGSLSSMDKLFGQSLGDGFTALMESINSLNLNPEVTAMHMSCAIVLVEKAIEILTLPPEDGLGLRIVKHEGCVKRSFGVLIKKRNEEKPEPVLDKNALCSEILSKVVRLKSMQGSTGVHLRILADVIADSETGWEEDN